VQSLVGDHVVTLPFTFEAVATLGGG
jgi:hypothetical protein